MTRRRLAFLTLLACILLIALVPWTVRSERVVGALARQIAQGYGVTLSSKGRLTLTLLPLPQFVLSGVRLESEDRRVEIEADELKAQLRLLPLLQARLRLRKLWLAKSNIEVTLAEEPAPSVAGTLAMLREVLGQQNALGWAARTDRFILTEAEIGLRDAGGRELTRLKRASLILNSSEPAGSLDLTAAAHWNGEAIIASMSGLNLPAIRGGMPQDVEAEIAGGPGRLSLEGRLTWSDRPLFAGTFRGQAASLSRLVRWSGLGADLRDIDRAASIDAAGSVDLDKLQWPQASIELGRDRLDGALALEFGTKPQIRATLAAGDLDLGWLAGVIEPGSNERIVANYDIRLSASGLLFGPARLRDAALSVQCAPRGIEVSLGRAGLARGTVRGRVSATRDGEDREIRALGWMASTSKRRSPRSRPRGSHLALRAGKSASTSSATVRRASPARFAAAARFRYGTASFRSQRSRSPQAGTANRHLRPIGAPGGFVSARQASDSSCAKAAPSSATASSTRRARGRCSPARSTSAPGTPLCA